MQSTVGSRAFQNARLQKKFRKQAEALLPAAIAAYREGRHSDAQALCRRLLEGLPNHFDALHLLGVSELDCAAVRGSGTSARARRQHRPAIGGSLLQSRFGVLQVETLR